MLIPKNNTFIFALTVYTYFSCSSFIFVAVAALVAAIFKCRREYCITVDTSEENQLLDVGGMSDENLDNREYKEEVIQLNGSVVCPLDFYRIYREDREYSSDYYTRLIEEINGYHAKTIAELKEKIPICDKDLFRVKEMVTEKYISTRSVRETHYKEREKTLINAIFDAKYHPIVIGYTGDFDLINSDVDLKIRSATKREQVFVGDAVGFRINTKGYLDLRIFTFIGMNHVSKEKKQWEALFSEAINQAEQVLIDDGKSELIVKISRQWRKRFREHAREFFPLIFHHITVIPA